MICVDVDVFMYSCVDVFVCSCVHVLVRERDRDRDRIPLTLKRSIGNISKCTNTIPTKSNRTGKTNNNIDLDIDMYISMCTYT
jgi:hypothetical protein